MDPIDEGRLPPVGGQQRPEPFDGRADGGARSRQAGIRGEHETRVVAPLLGDELREDSDVTDVVGRHRPAFDGVPIVQCLVAAVLAGPLAGWRRAVERIVPDQSRRVDPGSCETVRGVFEVGEPGLRLLVEVAGGAVVERRRHTGENSVVIDDLDQR